MGFNVFSVISVKYFLYAIQGCFPLQLQIS